MVQRTLYSDIVRHYKKEILELSKWEFSDFMGDETPVNVLDDIIASADVVLWKANLWTTASRGVAAYEDHCFEADEIPVNAQLWMLEGNLAVPEKVKKEIFHLDCNCRLAEIITFPIQYRAAEGDEKVIFRHGKNIEGKYLAAAMCTAFIFIPVISDYPTLKAKLSKEDGWRNFLPRIRCFPPLIEGSQLFEKETYAQILAHLSFMNAPFIDLKRDLLDRSAYKRLEKEEEKRLKNKNAEKSKIDRDSVRVVSLRPRLREDGKKDERSEVEIERDFCWSVKAHVRNQWYPSIGAHKKKWVDTYMKGNLEGEIKPPRKTVYVVRQ